MSFLTAVLCGLAAWLLLDAVAAMSETVPAICWTRHARMPRPPSGRWSIRPSGLRRTRSLPRKPNLPKLDLKVSIIIISILAKSTPRLMVIPIAWHRRSSLASKRSPAPVGPLELWDGQERVDTALPNLPPTSATPLGIRCQRRLLVPKLSSAPAGPRRWRGVQPRRGPPSGPGHQDGSGTDRPDDRGGGRGSGSRVFSSGRRRWRSRRRWRRSRAPALLPAPLGQLVAGPAPRRSNRLHNIIHRNLLHNPLRLGSSQAARAEERRASHGLAAAIARRSNGQRAPRHELPRP